MLTTLPSNRWTRWLTAAAFGLLACGSSQAQTTVFNETFEGTNSFTVENGTQPNKWFVGTVPGNGPTTPGTRAAYVSDEATGATHTYTISAASTVHMYRDVVFPAGQGDFQLSFDWFGQGESVFDYLRVFVVPTSTTPAAGTLLTSGQVGQAQYNLQAAYTRSTITLPTSLAGTTQRLVFTWRNDTSIGIQPPAALDNVLLTSRTANPLSGTYTINNTQPTAGTNFISFSDAINSLNANGISGPVTFNVSNGQTFAETPPALMTSGTSTNTITFREATLSGTNTNPKITPTGGTGTTDAGIIISGADYVTFDGIDIDASGVATVEYGYVVRNGGGTDGATNNIIRNAAITLNRTNTSSIGLVQSSNTSVGGVATTATAATGANQNNTYNNLVITNSFNGIWLFGATVGFADRGTQVFNVTIGSDPNATGATLGDIGVGSGTSTTTVYGLRGFNQTGLTVRDNLIRNLYANSLVFGLNVDSYSGAGADAGNIFNNRIIGVRNNSTTSTSAANGISVGLSGTTAIELNVYNNFVADITSAFTGTATATRLVRGIFYSGGGSTAATLNISFNSVRIDSGTLNGTSAAYEISSVTGAVINTRNNIFANFTGAQTTAKHYAIITSSTTGLVGNTGSVSNYNDLYVANTGNGFVGATGAPSTTATTNDRATLADWRTATMQDANSVSADPLFVSATDLHAASPLLNNAGTPLAGITTDIDGQTRNTTTPDIGADEFTPATLDIRPLALIAPAPTTSSSCFSATEAVTVQIQNLAGGTVDFAANNATVTVVATLPGGTTQTFTTTLTSGTLASGATQNVTLPGTLNMTATGSYSFAVTATVAGDQNTANNVLTPAPTRTVSAPVAGTLSSSNASLCVSGTTTLTLAGAANGNIQLQQSTDNMTFTNVAGANAATFTTPVLTQTTFYRAIVGCNAATATSNVVTVTVNNPQVATVTTPVTVCAGTTATLTATSAMGTRVRFFSTATGGTALTSTTTGTTSTATTPVVNANQTFFAEAFTASTETAGRAAPASSAGFLAIDTGLIFDATTAFTIQSAVIYPTGTGTITFALRNSANVELAVTPAINVTGSGLATPVTVPLNLAVPSAGTGYRLVVKAFTGITDLIRENPLPAGSSFPITSPSGSMSITTGINVNPLAAYYYFYNISLSADCAGATRTPIQVNVTPRPATPTLTAQYNAATMTTTLTSSSATGNQFFFNGTAIAGATGQTYTFPASAPRGNYTVVTTNAQGCASLPSAAVLITAARTGIAGATLRVFPNPTPNGQVTLELAGFRSATQLVVLDALGRAVTSAVLSAGTTTHALDLTSVASGVYTLRLSNKDGVETRKLVRE